MELKIRINDLTAIEEKLRILGFKFIEEINFTDTYFKAGTGHVLKTTEATDGNFLVELRAYEGRFKEVAYDKVENVDELNNKFVLSNGVKRILKGKRRRFASKDQKVTLNIIDAVGTFLVLTGDNPQKSFFTDALGISNPEYITVPFDEVEATT